MIMDSKRPRPKGIEKAINAIKAEARENTAERGTVQFRLDTTSMCNLLKVADDKRTGFGVLARLWVLERLNQEMAGSTSKGSDMNAQLSSIQESLQSVREQNAALKLAVEILIAQNQRLFGQLITSGSIISSSGLLVNAAEARFSGPRINPPELTSHCASFEFLSSMSKSRAAHTEIGSPQSSIDESGSD